MMSMIARRGCSIKDKTIVPCDRIVCLCIEYLDFSKYSEYETYRHCMITNSNNKKYERSVNVLKTRGRNEMNKIDQIFQMMKESEKRMSK
tara:strand:- start:2051 stop:2320 length:270 start_codon:yes stop_codon:yes gene_type:complete